MRFHLVWLALFITSNFIFSGLHRLVFRLPSGVFRLTTFSAGQNCCGILSNASKPVLMFVEVISGHATSASAPSRWCFTWEADLPRWRLYGAFSSCTSLILRTFHLSCFCQLFSGLNIVFHLIGKIRKKHRRLWQCGFLYCKTCSRLSHHKVFGTREFFAIHSASQTAIRFVSVVHDCTTTLWVDIHLNVGFDCCR